MLENKKIFIGKGAIFWLDDDDDDDDVGDDDNDDDDDDSNYNSLPRDVNDNA